MTLTVEYGMQVDGTPEEIVEFLKLYRKMKGSPEDSEDSDISFNDRRWKIGKKVVDWVLDDSNPTPILCSKVSINERTE